MTAPELFTWADPSFRVLVSAVVFFVGLSALIVVRDGRKR